jgi:hypothetical protein
LETGQTNRLLPETYTVANSTGVLKPRSTSPAFVHVTPDWLRSAFGFKTPVQFANHQSFCHVQLNVILGGFLEWESRYFG